VGARYKAVYRDGKLLAEYENGVCVYVAEHARAAKSDLPMPMVMRDIGEYRSPLDGAMITSRSQHRDHMRAHDVVEVGNEPIGKISTAQAPTTGVDYDLGKALKHRLEEVKAMPQAEYDAYTQTQAREHAAIAALATVTE
jgi:hypothetical protein